MEKIQVLDADGARKMLEGLKPDEACSLDFTNVENINFAGMRALLFARQQGYKINIIKANDKVATMFENAGVTHYISVCRQPIKIDMAHYTRSGEGFCGVTYNCDDGDTMLKLYNGFLPDSLIEQEKRISTCALQLGISTPMPGAIVTTGTQKGLLYERIVNKRSFARAISQEPENLEMYSKRFAKMCRQLHATECNTAVFPDVVKYNEDLIANVKVFNDAEKEKMLKFLHSVPTATTCLHGDMHIGNIITTGKEDLWIDMSDFRYGNPLFDLGMVYITGNCNTEEISMQLFHVKSDVMRKFWNIFVREYFGIVKDEDVERMNNKIKPFAALRMVLFASHGTMIDGMKEFINEQFSK